MDKHLDQLEAQLAQLVTDHEQLLVLVQRRRAAIAGADARELVRCCEQENEQVQRIAALEKRRQQTVGQITAVLAGGAATPLTLGQIAEAAGEPRRGRLLVRQQTLQRLMAAVQTENSVARHAVEGLLKHVQGILQQVTAAVGAAGTYGKRGVVGGPAAAFSSFSVTG